MGFLDDYEPVEDRLREFWADHPDGRIETVLEAYTAEGDYIVKASVWRTDLVDLRLGEVEVYRPSATGYAHDSAATLPPNMKASALEVCETSAIGRALANLGYAPKGKRPSREEMQKSDAAGTPASERSGEESRGVAEKAAPTTSPEHHFPKDPATCSHKTSSGKMWTFKDGICLQCGMTEVAAREGTTADLGSATSAT